MAVSRTVQLIHHLRLILRSARRALVDLYNSDALTHAASIAYYALLSLFPFFLLMLSLLGMITSSPAEREGVVRFVFQYFPRQFDFITGQLDAFEASTVRIGLGGLLGLTWASLGVFTAITSAVNSAWRVEKNRSFFKHRLVAFVMLISAGGALVIGLLLATAFHMAQSRWFSRLAADSAWLRWVSGLTADYAATVLLIGCVALIFYFIPNTRVRFRDVWPGAILVGLMWRGSLAAFSWYVRDLARWNVVHGSIAAVVVFMLWVFLSSVILLYGVQITARYSRLQDATERHPVLGHVPGHEAVSEHR